MKKYKIIVFGQYDGDDREYYITTIVRTKKPDQNTLEKLFFRRWEGLLDKYDNIILKLTDMTELTVYSAICF